jgi:hypothetical protein
VLDVVVNRAGTTAYVGSSGKVSFVDAGSGALKSTVAIPSADFRTPSPSTRSARWRS